jgi:hypothetical protein
MNEKNNKTHYLSVKELFSESLLRDLILFSFFFILIIAQVWDSILLLLFPLFTFAFSFFFRILSSNKKRTEFRNNLILYFPLGLEKKSANRLFFCTVLQLILIFWLGGESLYNPHLVNRYFSYFSIFLIFFYTFSFYWIFLDLWKYTKIEIITNYHEGKKSRYIDSQCGTNLENLVSFLNLKKYRTESLITLLGFLILNILNIITLLFINQDSIGIKIVLPGSQIIILSYLYYVFLFISPTLTTILLIQNYKLINTFNKEELDKIIEPLPKNIKIKIIENFKVLNNKINEQMNSE